MKIKSLNKWEGIISLLWIISVFLLVVFLLRHELLFKPMWLFILVLLAAWWGIGLVFAISGLKRGNWINRACAVVTLCAFAFFILAWLWPVKSISHAN
ncbi:MAG: hypothetical protein ACREDS_14775 [Limisphaerales bacterium]